MKTVVATIIETNEYKVKIDVEDGAHYCKFCGQAICDD